MRLRLQTPQGTTVLDAVPDDASWQALQQLVYRRCGETVEILAGFPPKLIQMEPDASLTRCGIRNGETLLVRPLSSVSATATTTPVASSMTTETPQMEEDAFIVRRFIPSDNSCLFNAILKCYRPHELADATAGSLRETIAQEVLSDRETWNEAVLGMDAAAYAKWIMDPKKWGGEVELSILAKKLRVEICALDASSALMHCYGQSAGFAARIYILFDGIHYDALALNPVKDGPTGTETAEEFDQTVFDPSDASTEQRMLAHVRHAHRRHEYTNTSAFTLRCIRCGEMLKGEQGASRHAQVTGHMDFSEAAAPSTFH